MKILYYISFLLFFFLISKEAFAQFDGVSRGTVIEINGVKALVFKTDGNGHGSAISVKAFRGAKHAWGNDLKFISRLNMSGTIDGRQNTTILFEAVNQAGKKISDFPIFSWCKSLGKGWYIPSSGQMEEFINFYLGNVQDYAWDDEDDGPETMNVSFSPKYVNELFVENGGHPFTTSTFDGMSVASGVYTSTKLDNGKVVVFQYNNSDNTWKFVDYQPSRLNLYTTGRAFYDF